LIRLTRWTQDFIQDRRHSAKRFEPHGHFVGRKGGRKLLAAAPKGSESVTETDLEPPIRIFLLLANRLLRDTLARLFRKRKGLLVVGCSRQEDCSPQTLQESQCDVLVLDSFDAKWLPANLRLKTGNFSALKSVLIGMSGDPERFLAAVRGGVTGYLLKEASVPEVVAAVRSTFRGEAICSPLLCAYLFQYLSQMATDRAIASLAGRPSLTLRQQQLVGLVAKGLTNKEIASGLNLSEYTVKNHIHRIMKQVGAGSRSQAIETMPEAPHHENFRAPACRRATSRATSQDRTQGSFARCAKRKNQEQPRRYPTVC
jgi:DNA-binding NarL/FixJ family response regulator